MSSTSTLGDIACFNARVLLARVIRSFRRTGDFNTARAILRNARILGTYPANPGSRLRSVPFQA
jgi:hypothetical protein